MDEDDDDDDDVVYYTSVRGTLYDMGCPDVNSGIRWFSMSILKMLYVDGNPSCVCVCVCVWACVNSEQNILYIFQALYFISNLAQYIHFLNGHHSSIAVWRLPVHQKRSIHGSTEVSMDSGYFLPPPILI